RCFPAGLSDFFFFGGIAKKKQPRPKINLGILLRYFFRSVRIREIPAAVLAVPVGGIPFCLLRGRHSLNLRQIDMVIRIQIPVGLAAYLADSFRGTGRRPSGAGFLVKVRFTAVKADMVMFAVLLCPDF